MNAIACDPYVDAGRFAALGVERVSLEALAERSDYVSVHTLLNAETRHLIGEKFFRRMKPTAIVINTRPTFPRPRWRPCRGAAARRSCASSRASAR
jgi:phosphoglycerate dehydrogenase-like enzyme